MEKIAVNFNAGNTVLYLAQTYGTVRKVVSELVQNMIDAKATRGVITVNLKSSAISSFDNGNGESKAKMKSNVQNIGASAKKEEDVGGKGIGNLAPLGIMGPGGEYQLITRPTNRSRFTDPFFVASIKFDKLKDAKDVFFRFVDKKPTFSFRDFSAPIEVTGMTTYVKCTGVQKTAMEWVRKNPGAVVELCSDIGGMYAAKIKENKVHITIAIVSKSGKTTTHDVELREFPGERQEDIVIKTKSGPITFEIYTTDTEKHKPAPQIMVRHQGKVDIKLRGMKDIWSEYKDVFESGYIQGYIYLDFGELNTERTDFLWSDELEHLIGAIGEFCDEYARVWLKTLRKQKAMSRYTELAKDVMADVDRFIKMNPGIIPKQLKGVISKGHVNKRGKEVGRFESPRKKTKSKPKKMPPLKPPKKEQEKRKHVSSRSIKGKGSERRLVQGQSGITLDLYEPDPLHDGLGWRKRLVDGIIQVNISHKDYKICSDKGNSTLKMYMRMMVIGSWAELDIMNEKNKAASDTFAEHFDGWALRFVDLLASGVR